MTQTQLTVENVRNLPVALALNEVGTIDASKYWRDTFGSVPEHGLQWCGIFALWALRTVKLCNWQWLIARKKTDPCGFLFRLKLTKQPQPGDLVYFPAPYQHHAILHSMQGDNLHLVQGNYGVPGHVAESDCSRAKKRPYFYSIEPLVQSYIATWEDNVAAAQQGDSK